MISINQVVVQRLCKLSEGKALSEGVMFSRGDPGEECLLRKEVLKWDLPF